MKMSIHLLDRLIEKHREGKINDFASEWVHLFGQINLQNLVIRQAKHWDRKVDELENLYHRLQSKSTKVQTTSQKDSFNKVAIHLVDLLNEAQNQADNYKTFCESNNITVYLRRETELSKRYILEMIDELG